MNRKSMALAIAILLALMPSLVFAHGKGHVKGTITAAGPDYLTIKGEDGKEVHVTLTNKTKFSKGKAPATAADVKAGSRVVIHLGEDGNAAEVQLPGAKPQQ